MCQKHVAQQPPLYKHQLNECNFLEKNVKNESNLY